MFSYHGQIVKVDLSELCYTNNPTVKLPINWNGL